MFQLLMEQLTGMTMLGNVQKRGEDLQMFGECYESNKQKKIPRE